MHFLSRRKAIVAAVIAFAAGISFYGASVGMQAATPVASPVASPWASPAASPAAATPIP